jgi:hypothetical protein
MTQSTKLKMYNAALHFLKNHGHPASLSESHIREAYLRYLDYCNAQKGQHLPEIYFKRVVRAHYFPDQNPKNLPALTAQQVWDFVSKLGE